MLTAPVGEGHLAAARVLADDLVRRSPSAEVEVRDVLAELPGPLRWFLNDAYRWQLTAAPWLFALLFGMLRRVRLLRWLARSALSLAGSRSMLRLVRRDAPDVVVSTWPPATLILGSLRLRGKVRVPACATITDFAGLELWADKGVDLHLVMHESLVPGVERVAGHGSACPVSPLVAPEFHEPRASLEARRALGLPSEGTIVVVSGGGWGVGDLAGAVTTALGIDATVVCLAGRDPANRERLEAAFAGEPRVQVLGFTNGMSDLLSAADLLVHSTGGVTSLEALARGCPVVAYGAPRGHARLLSREMASLRLVEHARSADELRAALLASGGRSRVTLAGGADAASLVLAAMPRVAVRARSRFARTMASTAAATALLFALLASDATYPVVAEALALPESTTVVQSNDSVALVVEGRRSELMALAALARTSHLHASVAASDELSSRDVAILRRDGLDPMPELFAKGVRSWFHAHGQLESQRTEYRLNGSFPYLAPREGFTIADYLLARHLGGKPVQAGYRLSPDDFDPGAVHSGEVVLATLGDDAGDDPGHLLAAVRLLERSGLGVSSVQRLSGLGRST